MRIMIGSKRTLTIPKRYCADLDEHTIFEVTRRDDGVIELVPVGTADPDQAWYWTERWQEMEREANEDYAAGRFKVFDDAESFLADLETFAADENPKTPG